MQANGTYGQDRIARSQPVDAVAFERLFRHEVAAVNNGVRIHYVAGGDGPPLVLLHGFPEYWREWRLVMPMLVESGYSVVAPDLRGFGDSDKPFDGYDALNVAADIHQLVRHLGHDRIGLVGHDVGASIAYTVAAAYPDEVRGLVFMEAFPAGLEVASGRQTWHLGFMGTPDLPETLLAGREHAFLAYLLRRSPLDPTLFSDVEVEAYARPFAGLGGIRGAAAHIRALPSSASQNRKLAENKLDMPVLTIGAQNTFGGSIHEAAVHFAEDVTGLIAEQCGHWIPEERPIWLAQQLLAFFDTHVQSQFEHENVHG